MSQKTSPSTRAASTPAKAKPAAKPAKASSPVRTRPASRKKAAVPKTGKTIIAVAPSKEQISVRAYEIWLRKGRPLGQDQQNWLEAESELKAKS